MAARAADTDPEAMDVDETSSLSSLSDDESGARASNAAPATNGAPEALPTSDNFRRRSTRVIKKPQPYVEPPSTRRPKRKRPAADDGEASSEDNAAEGDHEADASSETVQGDDDDEEEEDEDVESSETEAEDEESEGEPDEEELKERRKKARRAAVGARGGGSRRGRGGKAAGAAPKKPSAKRVKTDDESAPAPAKKPAPRKRAPPKPRRGRDAVETNGDDRPHMVNDVYEAVFESSDDPDTIAASWVAKYEANNADATKQLVNFFLKCCGCDNEVTGYDIEDQDSAATTLAQIQEVFQKQQIAEYPLTSKKPAFRKFRQHLSTFIESLISTLDMKGLFSSEPSLMESINNWIGVMSSSTLRQFRHTATVIALAMVTNLSQIAAEIRRTNGTTNRQIEAETGKAQTNDARIKALGDKLTAGEERRETIEGIIKDLFDFVFVHRYRDIDARIRSECMHELGVWILTLPDVFFEGTYLRYLGWVLSDTTAATRLEVVKALTKLFRRKNSVSGLRHFTERFRPRLVEMGTLDADSGVRTATVELLDVVREVGYLEPSDIQTVGRLLFDSEQKVRRAVVPFFVENLNELYNEKLEELGGEEQVQEALGDVEAEDYEGPTLPWIKLKCLVETLAAYDEEDDASSQSLLIERNPTIVTKVGEIVSRFSLAGAVLWDALEVVRDWEGITRYLLFDHSAARVDAGEAEDDGDVEEKLKRTVALDAKEDIVLLQVLNASVTGSIVKGPDPRRKPGTTRTVKEIEKHKDDVSRSLMQFIPALQRKFGPVPEAGSAVLRLQQLMNLGVFSELRQTKVYETLLDDINRQFLTHADEGVLKDISAALMHARSFEVLEDITETKISQLKDEILSRLVNGVRGKDLGKGKFSDAALTELINTVRRLDHLSSIIDTVEMLETKPPATAGRGQVGFTGLEVLIGLLKRGASTDELEEELASRVVKALTFYFMWKVRGVNQAGEEVADDEIGAIIEHRNTAVDRIVGILDARTTVDIVTIAAGTALLDLTALFVASNNTHLTSLCTALASDQQDQIAHVLEGLEKSFAKATRKTLEPEEDAEPEEEDEDDEPDVDENTKLLLEQRLCEFTAKIVVAVLARILDAKTWRKRLTRNQNALGPNYKEVIAHLERAMARTTSMRKKATAAPPAKHQPQAKALEEAPDEEEDQVEEEEEREEEQEPEEQEENALAPEEDQESEPDPEVEVPNVDDDGDEEMADA